MMAFCTRPPTPAKPRVGGRVALLTMVWHSLQLWASSPFTLRAVPLPPSVGRWPGSGGGGPLGSNGPSPKPSAVVNGVVKTSSP